MRLGKRFGDKSEPKTKSLSDLDDLDEDFDLEFENVKVSSYVEPSRMEPRKINRSKVFSEMSLRQIFRNRKIPIVTLDERFINLFPEEKMSGVQRRLRDELVELMKDQSRVLDDIKGLKRYKSQLMQEIMDNMEVDHTPIGRLKERKLAKNQKLIEDINQKLLIAEDSLEKLPGEIAAKNEELMVESLQSCYGNIFEKNLRKKSLEDEIRETEVKLRNLKKQKLEIEKDYRGTYTYLYDMLGTEMMRKIDEEQDLL
ncbi:hypothetical protein [Lachnoclostridium phytofermentans]|uniref:Uncharacterized protein n=1 Tax=Lachnoclostridium phytofermentans (strain ATCC 700394 / DSM 18823 / ISDg) TaxID=357809 RepID=A9KLF8_LACP7|nr:hypothetical protein [Lachnoclostridium phytofermentans]ABX41287.1 hypothetical protein Cphy_0902 [Lachnoclostridium phytofermentans ISDg]